MQRTGSSSRSRGTGLNGPKPPALTAVIIMMMKYSKLYIIAFLSFLVGPLPANHYMFIGLLLHLDTHTHTHTHTHSEVLLLTSNQPVAETST